MKNILLITVVLAIGGTGAFAQNALVWSKDFGASLPRYYQNLPTLHAGEDSIGVTGKKMTPQGERLCVVHYDYAGNVLSSKTYGDDGIQNGTITDYKFSADGYLYMAYKEKLGFYKSKIVLQKYALDGTPVWIRQIAETADTSYAPVALGLINDSTVFMTALREHSYPQEGDDVIRTVTQNFIYSYHADGTPLRKRALDHVTEINTFMYGIFPYNGTALLFGTNHANPQNYEICMLKVGTDGSVTVKNNIGVENGVGIVQTTQDNNLLVSSMGLYRVTKIDPDGNRIWSRLIPPNPVGTGGDEIRSMLQDEDGNIYVTGRYYSAGLNTPAFTNADILTVKFDASGNTVWQSRYLYGQDNADIGNCLALKNGKLYVGGESQRLNQQSDVDYVVLKLNASTGQPDAEYRYNDPHNGDDAVSALHVTDNGRIVLTGLTYASPSSYDWTTQLLSNTLTLEEPQQTGFKTYPNPVSSGATVTVEGPGLTYYSLISPTGQVIRTRNLSSAEIHAIPLENLPAGLYFLELHGNGTSATKKIWVK